MSYTQTQLDALRAAYASGVLTVEYDGKRVTYASRDDLKSRIDEIERTVNPTTKPRYSFAGFSKD